MLDGYHYEGARLVKTYKGSKRPRGIPPELWKMIGPKQGEITIREEEQKQKENPTSSASIAATSLQSNGIAKRKILRQEQ